MRQYYMKRAGHVIVCSVSYQHCNVYEPRRKKLEKYVSEY